jgi:hypothetical protein
MLLLVVNINGRSWSNPRQIIQTQSQPLTQEEVETFPWHVLSLSSQTERRIALCAILQHNRHPLRYRIEYNDWVHSFRPTQRDCTRIVMDRDFTLENTLALAMSSHDRLGSASPLRTLGTELLQLISRQALPAPTNEECSVELHNNQHD